MSSWYMYVSIVRDVCVTIRLHSNQLNILFGFKKNALNTVLSQWHRQRKDYLNPQMYRCTALRMVVLSSIEMTGFPYTNTCMFKPTLPVTAASFLWNIPCLPYCKHNLSFSTPAACCLPATGDDCGQKMSSSWTSQTPGTERWPNPARSHSHVSTSSGHQRRPRLTYPCWTGSGPARITAHVFLVKSTLCSRDFPT